MQRAEVLWILNELRDGAFADAARILEEGISSRAEILGPREPIPTHDLKHIYQRRFYGLEQP